MIRRSVGRSIARGQNFLETGLVGVKKSENTMKIEPGRRLVLRRGLLVVVPGDFLLEVVLVRLLRLEKAHPARGGGEPRGREQEVLPLRERDVVEDAHRVVSVGRLSERGGGGGGRARRVLLGSGEGGFSPSRRVLARARERLRVREEREERAGEVRGHRGVRACVETSGEARVVVSGDGRATTEREKDTLASWFRRPARET